jgi:hypothetical protein
MEPTEDTKKHGDKLESLIERTSGGSSADPNENANDDAADLQDDDDEDVQNDNPESRRDV